MSKEDVVEEKTESELEAEATEALGEVIDEAILEVSPHIEEETDGDNTDDDAGADAGADDAEGETDSDATDDGTTGDEDADADAASGDSTDSDGTDDAGSEEGEGDGTGSDDADGTPAEPDHINDPIPEATNEKTAERITGLIEIAKAQTTRADQGEEIFTAINDAGADPEQFSNTLGFLSLYNSTDPAVRKQALEVARGVVHELSVELGEGSPDLIARHADLQAEVEAGTLDTARATEIATSREREAITTSRAEHSKKTKDDDAAINSLVEQGKAQLRTFEAEMVDDPTYIALRPTFVSVLQTTLRSTHPTEYGATARTIYDKLKANMPAPTPKPTPNKDTPQPLRAKQGAGGSEDKESEAKSAEEAMDRALGDM